MLDYYAYAEIRDMRGLNDSQVAQLSGVGKSTFSDWKSGRSIPKLEKQKKIAQALGMEFMDFEFYLAQGSADLYIEDQEATDIAKFLFNNPEYKALFDATKKLKMEDIKLVRQLIERLIKD